MLRHTPEQVKHWREEGGVLLEQFFTAEEVEPCHADMESLYGSRRNSSAVVVDNKKDGEIGSFSPEQFKNFDNMPFECSPALNLLALHPALIELAKAMLGTDYVYLYQSHSWAKFTGEADFDQIFHCDFQNHTLTAPSEQVSERTLNCMIYLTDVTNELGAIHYVPKSDSATLNEERDDFQQSLKVMERSGAAPRGSIFAYGIDVYHRGTNMTLPGGTRYTLTASFKAAGNDMIGYTAWPFHFIRPWHIIFEHCSPEQLACIGVPLPGDGFWTSQTIGQTQKRWPMWNAQPYIDARQ